MGKIRWVLLGLWVSFGLLVGCGESTEDNFKCCMLRQLASHCSGTSEATAWSTVGNGDTVEACETFIDGHELGCFNQTTGTEYSEENAIVDCS